MSNRQFRLGLCQLMSRTDKEENMQRADAMVREAAAGGASVVVLPEVFQCPFGHEYFEPYAEPRGGESMRRMAQWANELGIVLVGGSLTEQDGDKLYNTCYVFDRDNFASI
jgi:predicted amidohydrolase